MDPKDVIVVDAHTRLVPLPDVREGDLVVCADGSAKRVGSTRKYTNDPRAQYSFSAVSLTYPHGYREWYGDEETQVLIVKRS